MPNITPYNKVATTSYGLNQSNHTNNFTCQTRWTTKRLNFPWLKE